MMVNMKMSPEEAKEESGISEVDAPLYPYGLMIRLNDESLEKVGLTELPKVGTKIQITAMCEVVSTSSRQDQSGEDESSVELQITDMELGAAQSSNTMASILYGVSGS